MNIEDIIDYNEWWEAGKVPGRLLKPYKRAMFPEIKEQLKRKQIITLVGMRRVGKTTLLYQLVNHLIKKGINPKHILYFSFDEHPEVHVKDVLDMYEREILLSRFNEIQKVKNWEGEVKKLYDLKYKIKFLVSGSASLFIRKKTKETLAGRIIENIMPPLSFKEFLGIKGVKISNAKIEMKKLSILFEEYLRRGGFPEFVEENDVEFIKTQIKEIVVDRIIYQDIPEVFGIREPSKILGIVKLISSNPGMIANYDAIAKDFNTTRQSISNIMDYLEETFLVRRVYNFSKNFLASERKLKKWYLGDHSIVNSYGKNVKKGKLVENAVINHLNAKFFWRNPQKDEVDVIIDESGIIPIEVKYKLNISKQDFSGIVKFCKKFKLDSGIMLTKSIEKIEHVKKVKIRLIPVEKFLLNIKI